MCPYRRPMAALIWDLIQNSRGKEMRYKILAGCALGAFVPGIAFAAGENVFFGDAENQVAVIGGYYAGHIAPESKNGLVMLQYSQPTTLFRLSARQNMHAGYVISSSDAWSFVGASLDAALIHFGDFYFGAGIGGFIRTEQTPRLGSRFTFGERAFAGYKITPRIAAEIYVQHFSNGDLTKENAGYNFVGLSANMNF